MFLVDEENAEAGDNSIILKVKGVDEIELFFRINRSTPLKKLMNNFCDRLSEDRDAVVFLSDGRIFSGEKTSDELGLKDGDEIEAKLRGKHITLKVKNDEIEAKLRGKHITLKVKNEVLLRTKGSTPLKKLMNAFCDRVSVDRGTFVFLSDDRILSGEKTPDELGLKDGDEIEAKLCGKHITLKIKELNENEVLFRTERSTPLKELMNAFCDRLSLDRRKDTFRFISYGRVLCGNKTPDDLGLEDGDELYAIPHQLGCICGCGSYSIT